MSSLTKADRAAMRARCEAATSDWTSFSKQRLTDSIRVLSEAFHFNVPSGTAELERFEKTHGGSPYGQEPQSHPPAFLADLPAVLDALDEMEATENRLARCINDLCSQTNQMETEIYKLREALKYYSHADHYIERVTMTGTRPPGVLVDAGKQARAALGEDMEGK